MPKIVVLRCCVCDVIVMIYFVAFWILLKKGIAREESASRQLTRQIWYDAAECTIYNHKIVHSSLYKDVGFSHHCATELTTDVFTPSSLRFCIDACYSGHISCMCCELGCEHYPNVLHECALFVSCTV